MRDTKHTHEFTEPTERVLQQGDAATIRAASARRTRRSFIVGAAAAAAGYTAWRAVDQSRSVNRLQSVLRDSINFDANVARTVFGERGLAPEYAADRAVPLRMNGVVGIDQALDMASYRLQLVGTRDAEHSRFYASDVTAWEYKYIAAPKLKDSDDLKSKPGTQPGTSEAAVDASKSDLDPTGATDSAAAVSVTEKFQVLAQSMQRKRYEGTGEAGPSASGLDIGTPGLLLPIDALHALPQVTKVMEFKCIEGWSQITEWQGVRLRDLIAQYPPQLVNGRTPRYVYMETPDGDYYCGYDWAVAMHPQTLLVTSMSGEPLKPEHGAPVRLFTPLKYGYKQIKRIGLIAYTDTKPDDYWTKLGYDWYAGL
jgi:hypothetical protein